MSHLGSFDNPSLWSWHFSTLPPFSFSSLPSSPFLLFTSEIDFPPFPSSSFLPLTFFCSPFFAWLPFLFPIQLSLKDPLADGSREPSSWLLPQRGSCNKQPFVFLVQSQLTKHAPHPACLLMSAPYSGNPVWGSRGNSQIPQREG